MVHNFAHAVRPGEVEQLAPVRLLIVDDVEDNRVILGRRFRRRGFEVSEADSGVRALEILERETFDVVLLDVRMPDMDGVEVLRRIRERAGVDALPVIMCTANNSSEDVVRALEAGANDYVSKPVDLAVALARVNAQVERKRANVKLSLAYQELDALNGKLEQRVLERTKELAAINDRLKLEIVRREQADAKTQYLAYHDALTGLGNRVTFREAAQNALESAQRNPHGVAVLFVDLDGFKLVNDTLGHSIGDQLLKALATRLRDRLPEELLVARLGGDEFGVLQASDVSLDGAIGVANDIIEAVGEPFQIENNVLKVAASVGIALSMKGEGTVDELLKGADLAMYRAKEDGRDGEGNGAYRIFDPSMDVAAQSSMLLKAEMREALANGEFRIFFQPIIDSNTRQITTFEALIRWQHPRRGLIGPAEFIPLAESTRYIVHIGEWVLREACRHAVGWPEDIKVAINVSPMQFRRGDLVATVVSALAQSGLAADRLELEITESVLLDKSDKNFRMLESLRALGVAISMDDFGTGFSSLSYLRTFPFDKIKIDQSFVQNMELDRRSLDIISAITGLGKSFGMKTVAEGVETRTQFQLLTEKGCTEMQGRYYSMPLPSQDIDDFLKAMSGESAAA